MLKKIEKREKKIRWKDGEFYQRIWGYKKNEMDILELKDTSLKF